MAELIKIENSDLNYRAFLCIDSVNNKMAFGGCRYAPSVTEQEVRHLAQCMTLKLLPYGLPVGGAKAGFVVDPESPNILKIVADFAGQLKQTLGTTVVIGKDLGATDAIMDHLYQSIQIPQLNPVHRNHSSKKIPGKIRELQGYQKNMTGKGVAWAAASFFNQNLTGKTVLIQGAGAVGVGAAVRLESLGAKVVGISDKQTCIASDKGIPSSQMSEWISNGTIQRHALPSSLKVSDSAGLFDLNADILVLAANSNTVGVKETSRLDVQLVVEGSNFGLKPEGRTDLFQKGISMIPDVIASSSSGAMVGLQMVSGNAYSDEELWKKISEVIFETTQKTLEISRADKLEMRQAYQDVLAPALFKKFSISR